MVFYDALAKCNEYFAIHRPFHPIAWFAAWAAIVKHVTDFIIPAVYAARAHVLSAIKTRLYH
jgi:hypothetical protein